MGPAGPQGPPGPPGPTGPQGAVGPPGEAAEGPHVLSHIGNAGTTLAGRWLFPREAGTIDDPPALSWFVAEQKDGVFFNVASGEPHIFAPGYESIMCALEPRENGRLGAFILGVPENWYYLFVVVLN